MKIHADFNRFAASHFDASQYIASPSYGVNRFMLDRIGEEKARATTIVEYQPNSKFPEHTHIGGEEFLVLKGTFKDQFGSFSAGTYVRNPIDSVHAPWVDADGCTILVKLLQMAETGEGTTPLHVKLDASQAVEMPSAGIVQRLYTNDVTGEVVEAHWLNAKQEFTRNGGGCGGEEMFVIDGSVEYDGVEYQKWGWLRFPPDQDRKAITAGLAGAQLYCKTGHLTDKALGMEKIRIQDV